MPSAQQSLGSKAARAIVASFSLLVAACGGGTLAPQQTDGDGSSEDGAGSSPGGSSTPAEAQGPSSGVAQGDLRVFAVVHADATGDLPKDAIPVTIDVDVAAGGAPVTDASVVGGALGKPSVATSTSPGHYRAAFTGLSRWYELSVKSSRGSLVGIRLRAPRPHKIQANRRGPNHDVEARWTPHGEDPVDDVSVRLLERTTPVFAANGLADDGTIIVPGSALSGSGPYTIEVRRGASLTLAGPTSVALVEIVARHSVDGS